MSASSSRIEEATAFFIDVLGYQLLYERGPEDSPQEALGVPAGSRIKVVHSLRCANGANVELFEFESPDQHTDFPRPNDLAIQHLALYVDDLDAAVELLDRHDGTRLLSGPNPLPGPEAGPGNRFIYARTPWGMTIEIISYPSPMEYQQYTSVRRWTPPANDGTDLPLGS